MEKTKREIGGRIRAIRQNLKLNQREFAGKIGVSNTAVSSYEQGDNFPSAPALIRIAQVGQVTLDWLVWGFEMQNSELQPEEAKLIGLYRRMKDEDKRMMLRMAASLVSFTEKAK